MKVSGLERLVLKRVFAAKEGMHVYSLHRHFRLPPGVLFSIAENLTRKGLVTYKTDRLTITAAGRLLGVTEPHQVLGLEDKEWRKVPGQYETKKRAVTDPYLPQTSRLHRSILYRVRER